MNATQTAILEQLATDPFTVNDLVDLIEKSETTVRKNLKELEAEGLVRKDGNHWFLVEVTAEVAEQHEYTKLMADTEAEDAAETITCDYPDSHPGFPCNHAVLIDDSNPEVAEAIQYEAEMAAEEASAAAAVAAQAEEPEAATDEQKATRKYQRHQTPTTRTVRKNQITGAEIQVVKNGETDRDGNEIKVASKWATVCLTHGHVGQFDKVLDAHFASSYPEFCPTCKDAMPAEAIGRRRRK